MFVLYRYSGWHNVDPRPPPPTLFRTTLLKEARYQMGTIVQSESIDGSGAKTGRAARVGMGGWVTMDIGYRCAEFE